MGIKYIKGITMKRILVLLALMSTLSFAQNSSYWAVDYWGSGNNSSSNNLVIAVGDSASGVYYINDALVAVMVDSNWTASGIGFMLYNDLEGEYYPVYNDSGLVEYTIAVGTPLLLNPKDVLGLKKVKFYKVTSGSDVDAATLPNKIQIITRVY